MGKFVLKAAKTGFKFDLKATNGQVIASSQVYKSIKSCRNGIVSVAKNAPIAAIEDQTGEAFAVEKNPKFQVYQNKAGEYRFRLTAKNGQTIAVSEGYVKMKSCLNGVNSVKKNSVDAPVEELLEG